MVQLLGSPEIVAFAAAACFLLYLYASRRRNYWKDQKIASEPYGLIFGTTWKLMFSRLHEVDTARYKKYGKLFGGFERGNVVLFVGEPELVKQVLVKDFPSLPNRSTFAFYEPLLDNIMNIVPVEKWRRIRPAASPAFSTGKLRKCTHKGAPLGYVPMPEQEIPGKDASLKALIVENNTKPSIGRPYFVHYASASLCPDLFDVGGCETPPMNYLIEDCAVVTVKHLKKAAAKEEDIAVKEFFGNYALDVIARCAFATRLDSHSEQTNEFVTKSRHVFSGRMTPRLFVCIMFPAIAKLLRLGPFKTEIFLYFKQLCQNIIKSRQDTNFVLDLKVLVRFQGAEVEVGADRCQLRHEDFLQLMMDAQEGKLSATAENSSERDNQLFNLGEDLKPVTSFSSNKTLNEDEAMAQCVLFFIAGQNTISTAVSYTLYLLALHPDVQERLRKEVDECIATHGEHPSLDVVTNLKYLHCIVSETLRMYPPGTRIERRSMIDDYVLGDTGVKLKKGDLVVVPVYAMHHDPEYFPDPFTFNPERFSEENVGSIQPYTYLPFGAGPRNCIGMRFALHVVKLSVLYTIRNVQLVRTEKTQVPLEFQKGFTVLTAKEITLGIRQRT